MSKIMTFRNDDVRGKVDKELEEMVKIFIDNKIPLTLAVEPINLTDEVVKWLLAVKKESPSYIEIMQHGYDHTVKNKIRTGEFGGQRTYDEQYKEIHHGKELMNNYFGDQWFEAFNYPFGEYNPAAMQAASDCGFKVVYSHFNARLSRRIFYKVGHLLNKGYLFDKHVSWNLDYYPNTNLFEIDANISFIKKYLDEETGSEMFSLEELKEKTKMYMDFPIVSLLAHHRYHNSREKMKIFQQYIDWTREFNFEYFTSEQIFKKFAKRAA